MARSCQVRVLFAVLFALVGFGMPALTSPVSGQSTPPGLGGTSLTSSTPNVTGTCNDDLPSTYTFSTSGTSTGAHSGTFWESGSATKAGGFGGQTLTDFSSSFGITSSYGEVTGTKWLVPGSNPSTPNPDTGRCDFLFSGMTYTVFAWNLRYEATIVTPDGQTCTAAGYSILSLVQGSSAQVDSFSETFYNDVSNPSPSCTGGGGGEEPPDDMPVTREDCFNGGWEAYGFKNQGECVAYVSRPN